jgi:hypothetical protein
MNDDDNVASDLRDFRGKLTALAWAYVEAESRATNREMSEIVREILHGWAERRHQASTIAQRLLRDEGTAGKGGER